jgi:hypothetical protein
MTRTNKKWIRLYVDGYDLSGYIRDAGSLGFVADATPDSCITDAVKNALCGTVTVNCGPLNAVLDNDVATYPAGLWTTFKGAGTPHNVTVAIGTLANPTQGDAAFSWTLDETSFTLNEGNGFLSINLGLDQAALITSLYNDPWGYILHAKGAETVPNASPGGDNTIAMGATGTTSLGGLFVYHLFTAAGGAGTATLSMEDSADGSTGWAAVTGATSPALATSGATTAPQSGIIQLTAVQAVKQYLRWQLALVTATGATFFSAFIRKT